MSPRRKSAAPAIDPPKEFPEPEIPDDITKGILSVWGADTLRAYKALEGHQPGWAGVVWRMYDMVDSVLGSEE